MPHFLCRLATEDGRVMSQSFFSPSLQECQKHFEEAGFCVLTIKRNWKRLQMPSLPFEKRIKEKEFIMFNQELVALIRAGYPILKSIGILTGRVKNDHLKEILMLVEKDIRAGKSLSEAFIPHEKLFSTVYIASLMAGERSGNLAETINRYISYSRITVETKSRIKTALTYPTILILFSFILLSILINFILPRFSEFYADFDSQLPGITRILITFSLFVKKHMIFVLAVLLLLVLAYFQMRRKDSTRLLVEKLKLKTPYGKNILIESAVSLFCRTLALLLEGGISLVSAISVASQAVPNRYLFRQMKRVPDFIKNGESLSESLKKTEYFPHLALDMIRIGESSANLEGMLFDVANVFDERIRGRIDTIVSLIQPIIIIFMGLIVGVMLLAVYLPIFNIIRVTQ
ncbi:MAG: type II secretion system F family protein [Candidatus Aminicenantes bacterium]|nr:type II secretion system F family protein [Candidatus Aminicenantes bacterium]